VKVPFKKRHKDEPVYKLWQEGEERQNNTGSAGNLMETKSARQFAHMASQTGLAASDRVGMQNALVRHAIQNREDFPKLGLAIGLGLGIQDMLFHRPATRAIMTITQARRGTRPHPLFI
jgi:hypothetical protein